MDLKTNKKLKSLQTVGREQNSIQALVVGLNCF